MQYSVEEWAPAACNCGHMTHGRRRGGLSNARAERSAAKSTAICSENATGSNSEHNDAYVSVKAVVADVTRKRATTRAANVAATVSQWPDKMSAASAQTQKNTIRTQSDAMLQCNERTTAPS
jgi:hypothetical protein